MATQLQTLLDDLHGQDPNTRRAAAEKLASLAEGARSVAVELVGLCDDPAIGPWMVAALEELGPPEASALADLARIVGRGSADQAYWAATLLGRLGPTAATAVGPLAEALAGSPHLAARQRSAWALGQIGPAAKQAVPSLQRAAADADPRTARLAAAALAQIQA